MDEGMEAQANTVVSPGLQTSKVAELRFKLYCCELMPTPYFHYKEHSMMFSF